MPALASIEELRKVKHALQIIESKYPQAYSEISKLINENIRVGYKNICKLLTKQSTPEELKNG